ncbi:MAG: hypothetical protein GY851_25290, partial [bacterium]|nr:hypothetical protein [bacterium]
YLSARMAWDPHADYMAIYREFTDAYYGPGAPHIQRYMEWFAKRCRDGGIDSKGFWGEADAWKYWVDDKVIQFGDRCFQEALDAVSGTQPYEQHVRAAYLPILFAKTLGAVPPQPGFEDGNYVLLTGAEGDEIRQGASLFIEIMEETGYNRWNEPTPYDPRNNCFSAFLEEHKYHKLDNGKDQAYVLPSLGGRVVRWDIGALGGNVFRPPVSKSNDYPSTGGYEEYTRFDRGSPGIRIDFHVTEFTGGRHIVLQATLDDGLELTRTIELAPDAPRLSIRTTYKNTGAEPVETAPRTHPEFSFDHFKNAQLYYVDLAGNWKTQSLYTPEEPTGDTSVTNAEMGAPLCLLGDASRNVGLANRFDAAVVRTCYGYWGEATGAMNLEIWGGTRVLQPGESRSFAHSYQYLHDLAGFLDAEP